MDCQALIFLTIHCQKIIFKVKSSHTVMKMNVLKILFNTNEVTDEVFNRATSKDGPEKTF